MKEIITERLILRKITPDDTRAIFENWASDPDAARYVTWNAHKNISETEMFMNFIQSEYEKSGCFRYGIELKEDQALIGMIDIVDFHKGYPVLGYCSGKKWWNHGYMTEALKAVVKELFSAGYEKLFIGAVSENIGSNRVIQKAGFTLTGSEEHELSPVKSGKVVINTYSITKNDL